MGFESVMQIIWAGVGSLGFCLLFNVRGARIPYVVVCAMVTWMIYLIADAAGESVFVCSMVSTVFATIFSEMLAHGLKAPVTAFLMPVLIPLVPGGGLYYTVYNLITGDNVLMRSYANDTVMTCLGIVLGIVGVQFIVQYWKGRHKKAA